MNSGPAARRRRAAIRLAVDTEQRAMGVSALTPPDGWDVAGFPLGGRVKVTGTMDPYARRVALTWVLAHRERGAWGALVHPLAQGPVMVTMPWEEFLGVVSRLAWLEKARQHWLKGETDE